MADVCNEDEGIESSIQLNETWLKSMEDRIQNHYLLGNRKRNPDQPATIFKVLSDVRQDNTEAFEPQIISFGPYHHGNPRLKGMEEHKWRYLQKFLARNPNKSLRDYVVKIKLEVDRARGCYWDEVMMEDEPFVEMLVLDGSIIVELLLMRQEYRSPDDTNFDPVIDTMWTLPRVVYDMLKLENQVPFFVLQSLYEVLDVRTPTQADSSSLSTGDQPSTLSITELVFRFINVNLLSEVHVVNKPSEEKEIHHVLHFFHSCVVLDLPVKPRRKNRFWYRYCRSTLWGLNSLKRMLLRVVSRESTPSGRIQPGSDEEFGNTEDDVEYMESIRTAQELEEAGIKFKRKKEDGFLEVTFSDGVIEMTPITIDAGTGSVFHNLLAFEQCYPAAGGNVTGYSAFLIYLIDTPADVGVLRRRRVVENRFSSDTEAAILVNSLCQNVVAGDHQLSKLSAEVEQYCRSSWPRWRAGFAREYFGNPWAIISLVAAVVLLFLTGVQTAFTVISYLWPSNNGSPSHY